MKEVRRMSYGSALLLIQVLRHNAGSPERVV